MWRIRLVAILIFIAGLGVGFFVYNSEQAPDSRFPFRLGLDLSGGTHLVYRADVSQIESDGVRDAMDALRDVIERRVNLFGVAEPLVQVEHTLGVISAGKEERLIVELPGVTDIDQAVTMIGQTPLLEFKLETPQSPERQKAVGALQKAVEAQAKGEKVDEKTLPSDNLLFKETGLSGRYLKKATLRFNSITGEPSVSIDFDSEGSTIFARITKENVGKLLAIYLDGSPISTPVIREEISGGSAEISGNFTPQEAKLLVGRLNSGALPVPIELILSEKVGASLGDKAIVASVAAGIWGFIFIVAFLLFWYRLPGLVAALALGLYVAISLSLFKLIPVTLTAAGLAGFILSIGMAVDANILIFERTKEELAHGKDLETAIREGFARAWLSIRDSNLSSMITAVILYWLGASAIIQGFALVFGLGVLISMLTAISVSRTLLLSLGISKGVPGGFVRFLFGNGFSK